MATTHFEIRVGGPDLLEATFARMKVASRGFYDVTVEVAPLHGVWECVGVKVRASDGKRRVDGGLLRLVKVAELVRRVAVHLEESGLAEQLAREIATPLDGGPVPALQGRVEFDVISGSYVDRTGLNPAVAGTSEGVFLPLSQEAMDARDHFVKSEAQRFRAAVKEAARAGGQTRLVAAASIYRRALRVGKPPTKAVQEQLGVSRDAAVSVVRRCRAQGLLPPTTQGAVKVAAQAEGKEDQR